MSEARTGTNPAPAAAGSSTRVLDPTYEGDFVLSEPLPLECGRTLANPTLHYAVYGRLNAARDNAVLVCHALTGSALVGSWWPEIFAPGAVLSLEHDFVICINMLGSCYGSTGPSSVNPDTGDPYGPDFPLISIRDNVRAQAQLLDSLGIRKLRLVLGGSIGGMQALDWTILNPDRVLRALIIGVAPLGAMGLALNHLQRQAILHDPDWAQGRYLPQCPPRRGLALARQIGMIFDIAGYLDLQGQRFIDRFDANAYLAILRTMDTWDPLRGYSSATEAFGRICAQLSFVGISSDWLFPAETVRDFAEAIRAAGVCADYREMNSAHGHDAFLAEQADLVKLLQ